MKKTVLFFILTLIMTISYSQEVVTIDSNKISMIILDSAASFINEDSLKILVEIRNLTDEKMNISTDNFLFQLSPSIDPFITVPSYFWNEMGKKVNTRRIIQPLKTIQIPLIFKRIQKLPDIDLKFQVQYTFKLNTDINSIEYYRLRSKNSIIIRKQKISIE